MKILSGELIVITLLAGLITACGSDSTEGTIYDTSKNPHSFPQLAVDLLDNIESGKLGDYDAIVGAFGQLYMDQSDLLDNSDWQSVVNQLGHRFRRYADSLADGGVEYYAQAAGMYTLASFARPKDEEIKHLARLFGVWQEGVGDTSLAVYRDIKGRSNLSYQVDRARRYLFGNDLQREFAEKFLVEQSLRRLAMTDPSEAQHLSTSQRAFLASLGLIDYPVDNPIVKFTKPDCGLIAYELLPIVENSFRVEDSFRVEVYYIPTEPIARDYTIAFWLNMGEDESDGYLPFDFAPQKPTSRWQTGEVSAAGYSFSFDGDFSSLSFGLYVKEGGQAVYLPIVGSDKTVARLPIRIK